ncbi:hypothetical protein OAX78_01300 [Planctomycetota bacterium]|nr:hypothetical protein [Planctomycetota bacterium]
MKTSAFKLLAPVLVATLVGGGWLLANPDEVSPPAEPPLADVAPTNSATPAPIASFVTRGLEWLVQAQHPNGGWGAGSHAAQQVRDPHAVVTDPATTAFAGMALLRCGHTPVSGEYSDNVRRAVERLVAMVEAAPREGPRVTDVQGTQPQAKLGDLVDTPMTLQFLSRALPHLPADDPLAERVGGAMDTCASKLVNSMQANGSWGNAGWAGVLQSSASFNALEAASASGRVDVDLATLERARGYQQDNTNMEDGRADASEAAGVELYAFAASARANAPEVGEARERIRLAIAEGKLDAHAELNRENLIVAGAEGERASVLMDAVTRSAAQFGRLGEEQLLSGFGNNGGEEFLSYMLTSESLLIAGGAEWSDWNAKMHRLLSAVQNPDGSWSGHHCISSPVFCTAAAVQCLTVDQ